LMIRFITATTPRRDAVTGALASLAHNGTDQHDATKAGLANASRIR
jgi:hypothetical protein